MGHTLNEKRPCCRYPFAATRLQVLPLGEERGRLCYGKMADGERQSRLHPSGFAVTEPRNRWRLSRKLFHFGAQHIARVTRQTEEGCASVGKGAAIRPTQAKSTPIQTLACTQVQHELLRCTATTLTRINISQEIVSAG
jgi:hypothetical protein